MGSGGWDLFKAAPHNSARVDCEENFRQNKAEKPQEYFVYFKV
jgi:hypothetical protein